jgi:hypothetical protein
MNKGKLKKIIVIVLMVILSYPLVELILPIKLAGAIHRSDQVSNIEKFSFESWTNGSFQESFQNYINDNIGLFPLFIKIHNQLEFTLFENIHTGEIVTGKDNYLFESAYITTYLGEDYLGLDEVKRQSAEIKELQDSLTKMGKSFVFCFAPGKPSYFPEKLPDLKEPDSTNYKAYKKEFEKRGINHLNGVKWFQQMKGNLGHYLFPKYGIHWSNYGAMIVTDSLVKYHERKFGWDLPNMKIISTHESEHTRFYDNDIAHSMNLFQSVEPYPYMIYPEIIWEKRNDKHDKKKMLIIGDSFTWDIYLNSGVSDQSFDSTDLWYYNQMVNAEMTVEGDIIGRLPVLTRHLDLGKVLEDYDGIIVISSEPNLTKLGWNISKDLLGNLKENKTRANERNNQYLQGLCKSKKEWKEDLVDMAKTKGISTDSMIFIYLHDKTFNMTK